MKLAIYMQYLFLLNLISCTWVHSHLCVSGPSTVQNSKRVLISGKEVPAAYVINLKMWFFSERNNDYLLSSQFKMDVSLALWKSYNQSCAKHRTKQKMTPSNVHVPIKLYPPTTLCIFSITDNNFSAYLMTSKHVTKYSVSYKKGDETMDSFTFAQKRNLTLFAFSTRMLFMGVEYAVIFPSVWLYLKIFHVDYWYLGLVLSAYNMVGIVSTILVGRLADATRRIRLTGFIWNLTEIAGNFVYAMHFHVTLPLFGRMIAGFGEGYISAMWGELARVTTKEQRTRYFAILKGSNLLGAAIGPALNLFLKEFNFYIGSWHIDFRTSPGFFMGIVWVIVTAIMLVFVYDLSSEMNARPGYECQHLKYN